MFFLEILWYNYIVLDKKHTISRKSIMQLNLRALIIINILLVNLTNLLAQSSFVLYNEISSEDTIYLRQSNNFLEPISSIIQLNQEDKVLIEKIIKLYQVSHNTLVDLACSDKEVANVRCAFLTDNPEVLPHLSLSPSWKKLPYKQKEFILAHEMAHFALGHLEVIHDEYITNLSKIDSNATMSFGSFSFLSMLLTVAFVWDVRKKMSKYGFTFMSGITGICAGIYAVTSTSLRRNQTREKEADIKAVIMLGDAQGGIAWLTDRFNKTECGQRFFEDTLGLCSHPSYYARMCNLQEWQAVQAMR